MQFVELLLSVNGKLDCKVLLLLIFGGECSGWLLEFGMEIFVVVVFSQLLGCEVNDIDVDFFVFGGYLLLVMCLVVQFSCQLVWQVILGQVMVVLMVGKLSVLLVVDFSDEQVWCLGLDMFLLLCESDGLMLFCFYLVFGFVWQFSVLVCYFSLCWLIIGIQLLCLQGLMVSVVSFDEVCEYYL